MQPRSQNSVNDNEGNDDAYERNSMTRKSSQKEIVNPTSQNSLGRKASMPGSNQNIPQNYSQGNGSMNQRNGGLNENTFLTQTKQPEGPTHSLHDFLFPAGKVAKLAKVLDSTNVYSKLPDICEKFGFRDPTPVIYMSGAKDSGRAKFYAGICRAAFRVDAVILDSGIKTGIEQFALRRKVKIVGVFPESEIRLPKINPTDREWNELANGRTHLFMQCNERSRSYGWGDEADLKMAVAKQIATGTDFLRTKCKIVTVVMGDLDNCTADIVLSVQSKLPIIVVPGAPLADAIIRSIGGSKGELPQELEEAILSPDAHIYTMDDNNSEDVAALLHFFLTVTPF